MAGFGIWLGKVVDLNLALWDYGTGFRPGSLVEATNHDF